MTAQSTLSAGEALARLQAGNACYLAGLFSNELKSGHCQELLQGQHPFAAVLCCSDSRVPPELLFGQGLGELFVVRNAGNVLDDVVLGSLEYAVEHLGVRLIVVLGHERCGAITAAVTASDAAAGHLGSIMRAIWPALEKAKAQLSDQTVEDTVDALIERTVDAHVVEIVASLVREPIIAGAMAHRHLRVVGMRYNLHDGAVSTITT